MNVYTTQPVHSIRIDSTCYHSSIDSVEWRCVTIDGVKKINRNRMNSIAASSIGLTQKKLSFETITTSRRSVCDIVLHNVAVTSLARPTTIKIENAYKSVWSVCSEWQRNPQMNTIRWSVQSVSLCAVGEDRRVCFGFPHAQLHRYHFALERMFRVILCSSHRPRDNFHHLCAKSRKHNPPVNGVCAVAEVLLSFLISFETWLQLFIFKFGNSCTDDAYLSVWLTCIVCAYTETATIPCHSPNGNNCQC